MPSCFTTLEQKTIQSTYFNILICLTKDLSKTILLVKLPLGLGNNNKIRNKTSFRLSHRTELNVIKILYDRYLWFFLYMEVDLPFYTIPRSHINTSDS